MSDFVKAIPFFAEFAKKEGPEALANFFEFIAANSEVEPEDSIRLRAILITMKTILSRMTLLYSHSCQLAALLFQSRLLLRPLPVDSREVRSHKLALIEECERVSLEPSRRFL